MIRKSTLKTMTEYDVELKLAKYEALQWKIKIIDIVNVLADCITIGTFYIEHFIYIDNQNSLKLANNLIRIGLLCVSIVIAILLIMRFKYKLESDTIYSQLGDKKAPSI